MISAKNHSKIDKTHPLSVGMARDRAKTTNIALSIKQGHLTRPFFSLGGLGFCQKGCICMPNLVMLITHFGQKCKYWPSKCLSRLVIVLRKKAPKFPPKNCHFHQSATGS